MNIVIELELFQFIALLFALFGVSWILYAAIGAILSNRRWKQQQYRQALREIRELRQVVLGKDMEGHIFDFDDPLRGLKERVEKMESDLYDTQ